MAYGSVHIPAGCTVKVGDAVESLVELGVLKGDASIEISYDRVKVQGSKAETLVDFIKNMKATAAFELYQLYLPNIAELLDGAVTLESQAGVLVENHQQVVASGEWAYDQFIPFDQQNGDGTCPSVDSVVGSVDGALVEDTDYFLIKDENGVWGFYVIDSATVTTESQSITAQFDYTPAASKTLHMGEQSAELVAKIVEFSKTIDSKVFRARLWSATNESGFALAFPDSANDDPASMQITMSGGLDTGRATGKQLIEIYDEVGLST